MFSILFSHSCFQIPVLFGAAYATHFKLCTLLGLRWKCLDNAKIILGILMRKTEQDTSLADEGEN